MSQDLRGNGRKKLLLLGKTGVGKSSLCNVISGRQFDDDEFPTSAGAESCTQKTMLKNVFFEGKQSNPISLIDTIGFDDPSNDVDADIIADLVDKLRNKVDYLNTIIIAVNGQNVRIDGALLGMLRIFEGMFGGNIWKHAVLVFTFLPRDEKSVKKRERIRKKSDDKFAQDFLEKLQSEIPNMEGRTLNYLIMDACYADDDDDGTAANAFQMEMSKLWNILSISDDIVTKEVQIAESEKKQLENKQKMLEEEQKKLEDDKNKRKKELEEKDKKMVQMNVDQVYLNFRLRGLIPADDAQLTQNGYEDCTFNKFATWAGRIKNKFMWEAARTAGEVLTLGVATLARTDNYTLDFEVVVAFGETPSGKEIFFTASFRGMDLVDKKYNGSVAMDIKDIVDSVSPKNNDKTTWVVEGRNPNAADVYVWSEGSFIDTRRLPWKEISKSLTLKELNDEVFKKKNALNPYHILNNNCHQFAKELFRIYTS